MKYVVDTHALIWYLGNHPRLSATADQILSDPSNEFVVPATAFAEVCWIVARRPLGLAVSEVLAALDSDSRFCIYPLDRTVVERSNSLHAIDEMHDRQIAATTALLIEAGEAVFLLTNDANITTSGSVPVIW